MFGALRDAGPDYWGRRVIEKHSGQTGLGEIDYLLYSPDDRAGALGFGLNQAPLPHNGYLVLDRKPPFLGIPQKVVREFIDN